MDNNLARICPYTLVTTFDDMIQVWIQITFHALGALVWHSTESLAPRSNDEVLHCQDLSRDHARAAATYRFEIFSFALPIQIHVGSFGKGRSRKPWPLDIVVHESNQTLAASLHGDALFW
jgi:hypothetical protein